MKGSREGDPICISDSEGYAEASVFDSWWIRRVKSELGTMIGERIGHEVYMKRENADSWNSVLEKEQILETYFAQLQKS
ncbi:uncharacterized protein [Aegilops tauschii subsp. strangulata]|uniref:uncharacterized protein n=1 Tax=Aegilops tauschii subsp. strangulata TaxID=200361 RepID=UPI003CC86523